jgi:hypothetical protein
MLIKEVTYSSLWKNNRFINTLCELIIVLRIKSSGTNMTMPLTFRSMLVKQSRNRPGVAQRFSGGLGSQISMTFSTWRWWGCQPHKPAAFSPRKYSWYSFSIGLESTPGPWYGRKEYTTEKSSDTTGNRSRDRPTSSAAPYPLRSPGFWNNLPKL